MIKFYDENGLVFFFTSINGISYREKSVKDFYLMMTSLASGILKNRKEVKVSVCKYQMGYCLMRLELRTTKEGSVVLYEINYKVDSGGKGLEVDTEDKIFEAFSDHLEMLVKNKEYYADSMESYRFDIELFMRNSSNISAELIQKKQSEEQEKENIKSSASDLFEEYFMKNGYTIETTIERLKSAGFKEKQIYGAMKDTLGSSVWSE